MNRSGLARSVSFGCLAAVLLAISSGQSAFAAKPSPKASASASPQATTPAATPATQQAVSEIDSAAKFAVALLRQGQWPVTGNNVCAIMAWEAAEGGHFVSGASRFNPLNTTQSMPGDSIFNSVGVRNYPDWQTGLDASVKTLALGFYDQIRASLAAGTDASAVLGAISGSVWGTKFEGSGTSVSGGCLDWAGEFDKERASAVEQIKEADDAIAAAQPKLAAATKSEKALAAKYATMQGEIEVAKAHLAAFARSLYITGVEPELMSKIDAVSSGDPVDYELLRSYPGLSATRDAGAITRSLTLLAKVGASKQKAADAVAAATAEVQAAQDRKSKADAELVRIERDSLPE